MDSIMKTEKITYLQNFYTKIMKCLMSMDKAIRNAEIIDFMEEINKHSC